MALAFDQATDAAPDGMRWIPGGTFIMGSDRHYPEEAPAHPVKVDGFWIDETPVTNRKFIQFVKATVTCPMRGIIRAHYRRCCAPDHWSSSLRKQ